jgi:hypothetical protein
LYPQDYISVNQANGTITGREAESDTSGDDAATPLRQPKRSNHDAEPRVLTLVSEETRDASPSLAGQAPGPKRERQSGSLIEKILSPSKECISSLHGTSSTDTVDLYGFNSSPIRDTLTIEPVTPQRHKVDDRRTSAFGGQSPSSATLPILERETSRRDYFNGTSIDPPVLCTPQNKDRTVALARGTSSDRSHRTRLPICQDGSISPSPRRRRARVWRTYKAKADDS